MFEFDDPEFGETDEQMLASAVKNLPQPGETWDGVDDVGSTVVFRDVPPSAPFGKALLFNDSEEQRAGLGLPRYQSIEKKHEFTLISPSSDKRINSTLGGSTPNRELYRVEMNRIDADKRGFLDGQKVAMLNDQATVVLHLQVSDLVKPGVLVVPKGAWLSSSESGLSINALVPGHKADMADGACYNDTQVDIIPV
jgi:anaerobic selenocysteine-containing dehydrogenase